MKRYLLASLICLPLFASAASAQCVTGTQVNQLQQLLQGNTVCGVRGNDRWQEQHRGTGNSGALWDYKRGPNDPVDPSKELGTWAIEGTGNDRIIRYTYTAFGPAESYTFAVYDAGGGTYNFCGAGASPGTDVTGATVRTGSTSCD